MWQANKKTHQVSPLWLDDTSRKSRCAFPEKSQNSRENLLREWFALVFDHEAFAALVSRAMAQVAMAVQPVAGKRSRGIDDNARFSSDMMIRLGARVRHARKTLGWRQGVLAENAGINPGNLNELELARKPSARIDTLAALAEALQVSTDYLLGFTDDAHPVWTRQEML